MGRHHNPSADIDASDKGLISNQIQTLSGYVPDQFEQIHSGNSRVYKVSKANKAWIAKLYPSQKKDPRDRLGTEYKALTFLWQHGIRNIPQPLHISPENNLGIYTKLCGTRPSPKSITSQDIDKAIVFLKQLKKLQQAENSLQLPPASEACFSIEDYFTSIQKRLSRLEKIAPQTPYHEKAQAFLNQKVMPLFNQAISTSLNLAKKHNIDTNKPLPQNHRTLSPSDFGFHNAIRNPNSHLFFVDFEYFGWDDPAKMIVEFLHHPAMQLTQEQKVHFRKSLTEAFQADEELSIRIQIAHLAFGLKWCLILLNEFLPDMLKRRIDANNAITLEERLNQQLQKAQDKYHDTLNQYNIVASL